MVAVTVLALAATAAIKLVIMAQNTLSAVKEHEELLNTAQAVEAGVYTHELEDSGTSGDWRWETQDRETEMFGEEFGRLNFEKGTSGDSGEAEKAKWRELTVTNRNDRKITLFLPSKEQEEAGAASDDSAASEAVSGDNTSDGAIYKKSV